MNSNSSEAVIHITTTYSSVLVNIRRIPRAYLPDATATGVIVERPHAMLPRNVIGTMGRTVDDALQFDGAANAVEFLRRRDSPVVVDCDERHCGTGAAFGNGRCRISPGMHVLVRNHM